MLIHKKGNETVWDLHHRLGDALDQLPTGDPMADAIRYLLDAFVFGYARPQEPENQENLANALRGAVGAAEHAACIEGADYTPIWNGPRPKGAAK